MQTRICKYLRHPTRAYRGPLNPQPHEKGKVTEIDPIEIDLCCYAEKIEKMPAWLKNQIGGGIAIEDGECDFCTCFEPLDEWKP